MGRMAQFRFLPFPLCNALALVVPEIRAQNGTLHQSKCALIWHAQSAFEPLQIYLEFKCILPTTGECAQILLEDMETKSKKKSISRFLWSVKPVVVDDASNHWALNYHSPFRKPASIEIVSQIFMLRINYFKHTFWNIGYFIHTTFVFSLFYRTGIKIAQSLFANSIILQCRNAGVNRCSLIQPPSRVNKLFNSNYPLSRISDFIYYRYFQLSKISFVH